MQNRRTVLTTIGTVGTVAIAGCSGSSDNQEEEQEEQEPEPANIVVSNSNNDDIKVKQSDLRFFEIELTNNGDLSGNQTVELQIDGESISDKEVQIDGGDSSTLSFKLNSSKIEAGEREYNFKLNDQTIDGGEMFVIRCPEEVPEHDVIETEDISYEGTERYEVDVRLRNDGSEYEEEELESITLEIGCDMAFDEAPDSITVFFWGPAQYPGYEQAYARGSWEDNDASVVVF